MAEQSVEQPQVVESTVVEPSETPSDVVVVDGSDHSSLIPRGAIAFGILMIIGYAFYFFMIWSEVVARGGQ